MKLITIILLSAFLQVQASGYAQTVSLSVNKVNLKEVFRQLRKQTGYGFLYREADLKDTRPVSLELRNAPLDEVLERCLANQPLTYHIEKNFVMIRRKPDLGSAVTVPGIIIQGKVTDEKGEPLAGVSIRVKNIRQSTVSNTKGEYKINVPNEDAVLVFSYIGFEVQERKVLKSTVINVSLKEKNTGLNEVVVTALNISREQRSLGYSAQVIDSVALNVAPTDNWLNALEGKVAGLTLNRADGPMGSSDIILRGDKSLQLGNSGALVVIDGVPVSNKITASGAGAYVSDNAPIDMGTGIGDVNPEDIASVSVLKGAAATALYGSRGANGAIVIVTKSGSSQKGLGISFSSSTAIENVNRLPDYQYEYGAGANSGIDYYSYGTSDSGANTSNANASWGPKLNTGVKYYQYDPATQGQGAEPTDWIAYPDNRKNFFRTGFKTSNTISIEGGSKTTKARFSVANQQNTYILENVGYQRTSVNLSLDQQINKDMKIATKVNYYNKSSDNLPTTGYSNKSASYFLLWTTPNVDTEWYRDYWKITNGIRQVDIEQNRPFNKNPDNPYFALYEILNPMKRNGLFGNINFSYKISPFLNFTAKTAIDMYDDVLSNRFPKSSDSYSQGFYREQNVIRYERNSDFLLSYNRPFNRDVKFGLSVGGNSMSSSYNRTRAYVNRLLIPGQYTLANRVDRPVIDAYKENKAINSLYAFTNLSYKEYIFLELTARNDWSSVFASNNNSYFYPSANLSLVLSDMFKVNSSVLSFAKLRLSYAEVGSDTNPYRIEKFYSASNFSSSITNPTSLPNYELKPERTKSYETGLEARFLRNRIGLDLTCYLADTYDQILSVPVEPASGYYYYYMNAGTVRNNGVEVQLWGKLLESKKGLSWKINFNGAINRGKILELKEEIESLGLYAMGSTGVSLQAVKGGSIGDIYGLAYQRNENGDIVYANGVPQLTTEIQKVGNAVPKFKGGIGQEFRYKSWTMNILFDGEFGHQKYSLSNSMLMARGNSKATLPGREEGGILGKGVVQNDDGTWRPNDIVVSPSVYYAAHYDRTNAEANVFDASYIKFREFRIDKSFSSKSLQKVGFKKASIGLYGRDLFVWTKWPGFDPQNGTLNDGTIVQGIEIGQLPSTRNMGVNIRFSL
ncbi:SusC/RagA family TonB-linked outer membrane protein [Pedobacter sp. BS3]|uniref:SusC/RagA family TonB-linked outer membrane protein n=1 Tax=Pedobacter sp. BS3 TaxID=2567937 RepID=UPI001659284D|nr:SusC/RagA family TonB-linked outer membrane protein [Pedobacter sp. BS3]